MTVRQSRTETGNATHAYTTAGDYTVMIDGTFPKIDFAFSSLSNKGKIREGANGVPKHGPTWKAPFRVREPGCHGHDEPDLSAVTSLKSMFMSALTYKVPLLLIRGTPVPSLTWRSSSSERPVSISHLQIGTPAMSPSCGKCSQGLQHSNQPIDNWNTSMVNDMDQMFNNASAFDQNLGNWDISSLSFASQMLDGAGLSTTNYDNTLIGWNTLAAGESAIPQNIAFSAANSTYCQASIARQNLIDTHGWTISDGGQVNCVDPATAFTHCLAHDRGQREHHDSNLFGRDLCYTVDWGDGSAVTAETGNARIPMQWPVITRCVSQEPSRESSSLSVQSRIN